MNENSRDICPSNQTSEGPDSIRKPNLVVFHKANLNEYYVFKDGFADAVADREERKSEAGIQRYVSPEFNIYRIAVRSDAKEVLRKACGQLKDQEIKGVVAIISLPPRSTADFLNYIKTIQELILKEHLRDNTVLLLINTNSIKDDLSQYYQKETESFNKHKTENSLGHLLNDMLKGDMKEEEAIEDLKGRTVLLTTEPDANVQESIKSKVDKLGPEFKIVVKNAEVIPESKKRKLSEQPSVVVFHRVNEPEYSIFQNVFRDADAVMLLSEGKESTAGFQHYTSKKFGNIIRIAVESDKKKSFTDTKKKLKDQKIIGGIVLITDPSLAIDFYMENIKELIPETILQNNTLLLLQTENNVHLDYERIISESGNKKNSFGHLLKKMKRDEHELKDSVVLLTTESNGEEDILEKLKTFSECTLVESNSCAIC